MDKITETNEKRVCWFTRCGLHVVLASVLSSIIVSFSGAYIVSDLSKAQLLKTFLPDLLSEDVNQKRIAFYAIKRGISKDAAEDVANLIGAQYAIEAVRNLRQDNLEASKLLFDEAALISPLVLDSARNNLLLYSTNPQINTTGVQQLLGYKPNVFIPAGNDNLTIFAPKEANPDQKIWLPPK